MSQENLDMSAALKVVPCEKKEFLQWCDYHGCKAKPIPFSEGKLGAYGKSTQKLRAVWTNDNFLICDNTVPLRLTTTNVLYLRGETL